MSSSIEQSNPHLPLPHARPALTVPSLSGFAFISMSAYDSSLRLHPTEQYEHVVSVSTAATGVSFIIVVLSCRAPVGHTLTHCPHEIHPDSMSGFSRFGFTTVSNPLFTRPNAPTPITSSQTLTQRPQSMHLLGSLTMNG